jgi:hypothetical protein
MIEKNLFSMKKMSALALSLFVLGSFATQTAHGMVKNYDDQIIVNNDVQNIINALGTLDVNTLEECVHNANKLITNSHQPDDPMRTRKKINENVSQRNILGLESLIKKI